MDPVTLAIITAIVTGAATGITTVATTGIAEATRQSIRDGYDSLKKRITEKFGAQSRVVQAVDDLEADPKSEGRKGVLIEELAKVKAAEDVGLVKTATALLAKLEEHPGLVQAVKQVAIGNSNVQVAGSGNVVNYDKPKS